MVAPALQPQFPPLPPGPMPGSPPGMGLPGMQPPPMGMQPPTPTPMPMPQPGPPPGDPLALGLTLAGMSDVALRGYLRSLDRQDSIALLQLMATFPEAEGLIARIAGLLPTPSKREPKPPRGWVKPDKPTPSAVIAFANDAERRYATFRAQVAYDLEVYAGERTGAFAADAERFKRGEFEPFWSTALKNEADLARAAAATAPVAIKHQARNAATKRESQECEDALRDWRRKNALRWAESGHQPLPWCEATSLILTGVVVGRVVIDPEDSACPVRYDPIDPTTCYPEFGGRFGLRRVVRKYCDTVANVAGDYGVDPDTLRRRTNPRTRETTLLGLDELVDVVDYWDDYYRGVFLADGTVVVALVPHKYYVCPFVYQIGALGLPDYLTTSRVSERVVTQADGTRVRVRETSRDDDPARSRVSHIRGPARRHLQEEAVYARIFNMAAGMGNEAVNVYQDEYARVTHKNPKVDKRPGKANPFLLGHEEVAPAGEQPDPAILIPLTSRMAKDEATDLMPPEAHGLSMNSQSTGSAIEGKQEAGNDKKAWIVDSLELFHARVFKLQLVLFERWGHILGEPGDRGKLSVPYARARRLPPGSEPYFSITPETVTAAGTHVEVDLTDVARKNLAALGAAGSTLTSNEYVDRWWVQDNLLNIDDPDEMQARIRMDKMMDEPGMLKISLLAAVRERYTLPDGTLDPEGEWWQKAIEREYAATSGQGGGGQPPMGQNPPGTTPGMGAGLTMPATSGTDLTAFNPNVGMGAGRPGLPGPTPLPLGPGPGGPPFF